jgi:hypothetical protein
MTAGGWLRDTYSGGGSGGGAGVALCGEAAASYAGTREQATVVWSRCSTPSGAGAATRSRCGTSQRYGRGGAVALDGFENGDGRAESIVF